MKWLKKALRLLFIVLLVVLASFGIGLGGGAPIPRTNKKEDAAEANTELIESKGGETAPIQKEIK